MTKLYTKEWEEEARKEKEAKKKTYTDAGVLLSNVADFVFLMLVPAVLGATVLELKDISSISFDKDTIILYIISFLVTLVVTYFAFELLLLTIRKSKFIYFTIYCEIIGLITLIFGLVK